MFAHENRKVINDMSTSSVLLSVQILIYHNNDSAWISLDECGNMASLEFKNLCKEVRIVRLVCLVMNDLFHGYKRSKFADYISKCGHSKFPELCLKGINV